MKSLPVALGILGLCLVTAPGAMQLPKKQVARFEGKDTLLRPKGYREWVFVGSSLALEYNAKPTKKPGREVFKNVYINPSSYRAFRKTGKFPEGTVLMLEVLSKETKNEPGLQGTYGGQRVSLAASVKDGRRFKEGWGYYSFGAGKGKLKDKATPFDREVCWSCHHRKAKTDHVFTQFYPVLRDATP